MTTPLKYVLLVALLSFAALLTGTDSYAQTKASLDAVGDSADFEFPVLSPQQSDPIVAAPALEEEINTNNDHDEDDLAAAIESLQSQIDDLQKDYDRLVSDDRLRAKWDERFEFEAFGGDFRLVVGARVENDFATFDVDDAIDSNLGPIEDGTQFRRARLVTSAKLYDNVSFFSQYDVSTGRARFASVYLGFSDLPRLHNLRIGQFEEPLGLERLMSHRFTTFMERGLTNAITPVRSTGVMLYDTAFDRMATWWIGYFRESNSVGFSQGQGGNALTGRLTRLLTYQDKGRRLVHVGVAASHRTFLEDMARFRNRPESNLSTRFVDTGEIPVDYVNLLAAELAIVRGSLSFQGEYIHNWSDTQSGESLEFSAFYVTLSWLLTGEHRTYSRSSATFRRIRPHNNWSWKDGCFSGFGAWELAGRFSSVDLDDGSIRGGRQRNYTAGVNWYMTPHTRMMLNFIHADREEIGQAEIFQGRLQIDF